MVLFLLEEVKQNQISRTAYYRVSDTAFFDQTQIKLS